MTREEIKRRLPNATEACIKLNLGEASLDVCRPDGGLPQPVPSLDAGLQHTIPEPVPGKALVSHPPTQSGSPDSPAKRPHVEFTLYRIALLDPDNKWASVKFVLDAMRYAGLIPNDRECDIELVVTQVKVAHRNLEGTGVAITYPHPHHLSP